MVNLAGKKVAVLGLGIEGQDLCQYLLAQGAKVTVFDQKTASELGKPHHKLKNRVEFFLGKDCFREGLGGFSYIFRSPGFKPSLPFIKKAQKQGAIVSSAAKLFFDLCPGKIIGVTGTKGKGTTATLIYQILKKAKKDVFLAGNIGQPMLSLLPKVSQKSWVVLELSSFQLIDLAKSPQIGVVLFVASEHLDYHANTKEYIQAKSNLVRHQRKKDWAVLNADDPVSLSFSELTKAQIYYFSRQKKVRGAYIWDQKIYFEKQEIGEVSKLKLRGTHNWENVCAAVAASRLAGAGFGAIKKAVFAFEGLEHRLEKIFQVKEISFYNDSFSTTPETTIAAIKAFEEPMVLIVGGSEKGSNYTLLGKEIARSRVRVLILIGAMAAKIKKACLAAGFKGKIIFRPKSMKEAVNLALKEARKGEVVLLSPACASFDMFENYKDRGSQFKKYVQALSG